MAPHSSTLAWRIPGTGEPGGLLSMGSHRVGQNYSDLAAAAAEWLSPTPVGLDSIFFQFQGEFLASLPFSIILKTKL